MPRGASILLQLKRRYIQRAKRHNGNQTRGAAGRDSEGLIRCPRAISWGKGNVTKEIKVGFGSRSQACWHTGFSATARRDGWGGYEGGKPNPVIHTELPLKIIFLLVHVFRSEGLDHLIALSFNVSIEIRKIWTQFNFWHIFCPMNIYRELPVNKVF